jgi:predicted nucleic acid-binding protein
VAPVGTVAALLDTSVLFPYYLRDTLLTAAEQDLYQPRWSNQILEELVRVLRERRHVAEYDIRRLVQQMRVAFPLAEVEGFEPLFAGMPNDPGDRHVLAAAVHGGVSVIVTSNLRHFPRQLLAGYGIEPQSADEFLLHRLNDAPRAMADAVALQLGNYRAPALTLQDLCDRLAPSTPKFAARLRTTPIAE